MSNQTLERQTVERHTQLATHLRYVAANSPYYQDLWRNAFSRVDTPLTALPVTDLDTYWAANTPTDNRVLTAPHMDGPVFKSGGTTGNPKFSFYSNDDWRHMCETFGAAMRRGGLRAGERVANLFYGGQLYASFLFIGRAIEQAGCGVQFPLSGSAPAEEVIKTIQQFRIETLACLPTTMLALLPEIEAAEPGSIPLRRVLYGGEAIFDDQIEALHRVLPHCAVQSVGIAGVDYGELGWSEPGTEQGVHRMFDDSTVLELLDERGEPIDEPDVAGELVITNFKRRLMPVVRYPVGDRGIWVDTPGTPARRFRVLGRSNNCARIGPVSLYAEDVHAVLRKVPYHGFINFQMVVEHSEHRDRCTLRIAVARPQAVPDTVKSAIVTALHAERPLIADVTAQNVIHPLAIEWVTPQQLIVNERTGKTLHVIDRRLELNA